jgi:hypothetical protein
VVTELWWWKRCERGREGGSQEASMVVDVVRVQAAEFKFTNKNESENEPKNDHFCKRNGRVQFFKYGHCWISFISFLKNEIENEIKNEPKMSQKWLL